MPRKYPLEFRRNVLDLIEAGRPVAEIAALLGISFQPIYNWRNQDRIDRGLVAGVAMAESAGLTAARKRIRDLETELAVTKRANELLKAQTDSQGTREASTNPGALHLRSSRRNAQDPGHTRASNHSSGLQYCRAELLSHQPGPVVGDLRRVTALCSDLDLKTPRNLGVLINARGSTVRWDERRARTLNAPACLHRAVGTS